MYTCRLVDSQTYSLAALQPELAVFPFFYKQQNYACNDSQSQ
jgi:hypothetical protein